MPAASGDLIRRRVHYHGHVQGVCFRATARELARLRPVVGYVRNLPDGSVELEIEGRPADVDAVLADIERHFAGHIERVDRAPLTPLGAEARFEIRY